jgi:hypothetical protein
MGARGPGFAEALRRGGELDGARILSPALLDLATRNHTGAQPNPLFDHMREMRGWDEFPAMLGLGFFLRGEGLFPMPFGLTASPRAFGGLGAGSTRKPQRLRVRSGFRKRQDAPQRASFDSPAQGNRAESTCQCPLREGHCTEVARCRQHRRAGDVPPAMTSRGFQHEAKPDAIGRGCLAGARRLREPAASG